MTQESYNALLPYKELMRTIIINSAASSLPIEYREALVTAGKEDGHKLSCTCSTGWYSLTNAVYHEFLKFTAQQNETKTKVKRNSKPNTTK